MKRSLRELRAVRLTWPQLGVLTIVSALASGLVIATALGRSGSDAQALALLRHPRVERIVLPRRRVPPAPAASSGSTPAPATPVSGPSTAAAPRPPTTTNTTTTSTPTPARTPLPSKVKHVFVIALGTSSYEAAFGPGSAMPYLGRVLRQKGDLLTGYETLGTTNLPDYLAMVSGQGPNFDTERGCTTYAAFPARSAPNKAGEIPGRGCVYPNTIVTIGDQLDAAGTGWRGYFEGMGTGQPATAQSCEHPNSNAVDATLTAPTTTPAGVTPPTTTATTTTPTTTTPGAAAPAGATYLTSENPFVYFHSLLDLGDCTNDDLPLTRLPGALRATAHAPNLVYLAPGATPGGLAASDAFLKRWVPLVLGSPVYRKDGVLIIVFASSTTRLGAGASFGHPIRTGALVISRYAKAGSTSTARYTPYSVLRSIEDLFALKPLAHAASARSFATVALPGAWPKTR